MLHTLSLDGIWKARWSNGQRGKPAFAERENAELGRYIDAQVPGDIHLDLLRAGLIQDPYVGTNVLSARWVEEMYWSYRRTFDVPADALKGRAWLVFDGLDLDATIVLNGQTVGSHRNSFYPCRVEVTGKLRPGQNLLNVHIESGLYSVADKPNAPYEHSMDSRLHKRHWQRKPQCQFEWDWSQRLLNVGIHRSVRLEYTSDAVRLDQLVPLVTVADDLKSAQVKGRLFVENLSGQALAGKLTLRLEESGETVTQEVQIKPGLHPIEATLAVASPRLWWPVGHGEQPLYTLRATLDVGSGDSRSAEADPAAQIEASPKRIGFRHVRVDQSKHPESGRYFIIHVNNRPIFCKGGNFVPADMILANLARERYERLVDLALEANFNFLRIWGGGQYETDDFYELCDEKGILVWQEFIYACGKYPTIDHEFHEDVKREAIYQIRRLASHPSLIAWCGNNEMESAAWGWPQYQQGYRYVDYAFFHLTLRRLMTQEDPTRYYQPSSPISPDHDSPDLHDRGDQHPWEIGFFNTDFRGYRQFISRFPNEGGIMGPNSLPTTLACLPEGQRFAHSFAWQIHDNAIAMWDEPSPIDAQLLNWTGKRTEDLSVEDYVYWGGLVQAEGLREYVDNYHRRVFDSSAAIFWMYNDTWPTVRSWTIVDYYLRRTPSFHAVRRAMAPVNVVLAEVGDEVVVFGINETQETARADLRFGVMNLAGGYPLDQRAEVTLKPNASTRVAAFPRSKWADPSSSVAFAILTQGDNLLARNRLFLPLFKDMKWPKAEVSVKMEAGRAVFTSPTFAWGVCLDLDGETELADNLFDVYPGIPYAIPWSAANAPRILKVGNLV